MLKQWEYWSLMVPALAVAALVGVNIFLYGTNRTAQVGNRTGIPPGSRMQVYNHTRATCLFTLLWADAPVAQDA